MRTMALAGRAAPSWGRSAMLALRWPSSARGARRDGKARSRERSLVRKAHDRRREPSGRGRRLRASASGAATTIGSPPSRPTPLVLRLQRRPATTAPRRAAVPFPVIVFRASSDHGATWGPDRFLAITKKPQNDPMIEVANDGTIYAAGSTTSCPGSSSQVVQSRRHLDDADPWLAQGGRLLGSPGPHPPDGRDVYIASMPPTVTSRRPTITAQLGPNRRQQRHRYCSRPAAPSPHGDVYFITTDFTQDYTGDAFIASCARPTAARAGRRRASTARASTRLPWAEAANSASSAPPPPRHRPRRHDHGRLQCNDRRELPSSLRALVTTASTGAPQAPLRVGAATATSGPRRRPRRRFPRRLQATAGQHQRWNTWFRETENGGNTWKRRAVSDLGSGGRTRAQRYRFRTGLLRAGGRREGMNHFWGEGISFTGLGGLGTRAESRGEVAATGAAHTALVSPARRGAGGRAAADIGTRRAASGGRPRRRTLVEGLTEEQARGGRAGRLERGGVPRPPGHRQPPLPGKRGGRPALASRARGQARRDRRHRLAGGMVRPQPGAAGSAAVKMPAPRSIRPRSSRRSPPRTPTPGRAHDAVAFLPRERRPRPGGHPLRPPSSAGSASVSPPACTDRAHERRHLWQAWRVRRGTGSSPRARRPQRGCVPSSRQPCSCRRQRAGFAASRSARARSPVVTRRSMADDAVGKRAPSFGRPRPPTDRPRLQSVVQSERRPARRPDVRFALVVAERLDEPLRGRDGALGRLPHASRKRRAKLPVAGAADLIEQVVVARTILLR